MPRGELDAAVAPPEGSTTPPVPDPADLVAAPRLWVRVAWYAGAIALACVLVYFGLRLDLLDLRAPLAYDGDVLLIMPMVKGTLEYGTHWRNERLGYPGIYQLYDFPVIDHLHFAIIWLLGLVVSDWVLVFNGYHLLTYPLTALTAMYAFRWLGLTLPMAAAGGILYAFLPYHYMRGEAHYFLAAYWVVPLSWLPALAICRGALPFFRRESDGTYRAAVFRWRALGQVVLAAATASAGAYYAFFACAIYAAAGVIGWVSHRTGKAAVSAGVLIALVTGFGILNHLPTIEYSLRNGRNAVTERLPGEAEVYGLKLAHLLLPVDAHNLTFLSRVKSRYNSFERPLQNENTCATLGAAGSVGLVILLAALVLPNRRVWPYGPVGVLAAFIILFATIGGLASLFNLMVFDQIRCTNRISIYLAFICLYAALLPLDRFLVTRTGWARRVRYPAVAALIALGVIDQTPTAWFTPEVAKYPLASAERFGADRRYFARIEEAMAPGSKVFTIPYVPFPEEPALHGMFLYEHIRGYLLTDTLVWSYGAMKNREDDAWHDSVAHDARDRLLQRVVARGFDGLLVDKRGFASREDGDAFIRDIRRVVQVDLPIVEHEDGLQAFLDLRPYRDRLRAQDPARFDQWAREEREWVALTWINGFQSGEPYGLRNRKRWTKPTATAMIVNPSDRTRRFRLSATFSVESTDGPFRIQIDGGGITQGGVPWSDDFVVAKRPDDADPAVREGTVRQEYLLDVPPGRHAVKFRCRVPRRYMPDSQNLCYSLRDIQFVEVR
jgi:hypothetical protein